MAVAQEDMKKAIEDYWEAPTTVSIIDKNLHKIEIDSVCRWLLPTDYLADIGCGDGQATIQYAQRVQRCVGIEHSNNLRGKAMEAASRANVRNLEFKPGNILELRDPTGTYDAIVTQRMLINLTSWEEQQQAIMNIHRILKVGGRFIMIENTNDAFNVMNDMRSEVGLPPVPQHWHNRFFDHQEELGKFMPGKFQLLESHDFGLYYFLTRVFTPMFASFVGYGIKAVKDPIYERADAAARQAYEHFRNRVKVTGCRAFGPIQFWVYRREA